MNNKRVILLAVSLVVFVGFLSGCDRQTSIKDRIISNMVKGGLSSRSELLAANPKIFSDYRVYRDGEKESVVYEFIYAEGVTVDQSQLTPENMRKEVVSNLLSNQETIEILNMGITSRMVYKSFEGEVLCDFTLTADDITK